MRKLEFRRVLPEELAALASDGWRLAEVTGWAVQVVAAESEATVLVVRERFAERPRGALATHVDDATFIRAWQTSGSPGEVAARLGMASSRVADNRARRLRRRGVALKRMRRGAKPLRELRHLAESYA